MITAITTQHLELINGENQVYISGHAIIGGNGWAAKKSIKYPLHIIRTHSFITCVRSVTLQLLMRLNSTLRPLYFKYLYLCFNIL